MIDNDKIIRVLKEYRIKIFIDIGDLWFVVKDLRRCLGIKSQTHILLNLDQSYKSKRKLLRSYIVMYIEKLF